MVNNRYLVALIAMMSPGSEVAVQAVRIGGGTIGMAHRPRWPSLATAGVVAVFVFTACSPAAAPIPTPAPATQAPATPTKAPATPIASASAVPATASPTGTPYPSPSASQVAVVRCAETPDASPSATVQWDETVVGSPTIEAGQAVAFITTVAPDTVTEGRNGSPALKPCIDKTLSESHPSVVVTFYQPGDYYLFCRFLISMNTVVHVQ